MACPKDASASPLLCAKMHPPGLASANGRPSILPLDGSGRPSSLPVDGSATPGYQGQNPPALHHLHHLRATLDHLRATLQPHLPRGGRHRGVLHDLGKGPAAGGLLAGTDVGQSIQASFILV